jgi:hypothetical protein
MSRRHRHHEHTADRIARYKRNALVGNAFGLTGIAMGVYLVLFRAGIFNLHSDEVVLGMLVFLCGYAGVIWGCWWWVKAKAWPDAVIVIGLLPLVICFIPYVRLIYLAAPALLPTSMIMMPIILIVVVFVLPDKSGQGGRNRW